MFLPSPKKKSQFNPFQGFGNTASSSKRKNLDNIEDADYEDITNKDN